MTHKFYLRKPSSKVPTPIILCVSQRGKQYHKYIGISVLPSQFVKQKTKDPDINARLKGISLRLDERLDEFSTEADVVDAMEYALEGMPRRKTKDTTTNALDASEIARNPSFWEYFSLWSERDVPTRAQRRLCYKNIKVLMGEKGDWEDIDSAFHFRLVERMRDRGWSVNYQWRTVQQLRTVLNEGLRLKYHQNRDHLLWKNPREKVDTIYLTASEVDALWDADLPRENLRKARDLFLLGVYTASRFSDYSRLDEGMIDAEGLIHFVQKKTSDSVSVPASPRVRTILSRWGGRAPVLSHQKMNDYIKEACELAGITAPTQITYSEGARHITEVRPKCKLVSSHTARRTGATLLFQTGISLQSLMLITGHRSVASVQAYLRLGKEENAKSLKENPFFR